MSMAKSKREPRRVNFEDALVELEKIVDDLERGDIGLDESMAAYEKGVKVLKQCQDILAKAEKRIAILSGKDAEGNPIETPLGQDDVADQSPESGPSAKDDKAEDGPVLF
jgi:exodeoxyribonuclease VII small subunit